MDLRGGEEAAGDAEDVEVHLLVPTLAVRGGRRDAAAIWAAVALAFFFLLRASEYLGGTQRAVRGADLEPRRGGARVASFRQAEEVVLQIRQSKTDQYNQGTTRNQFRSGDLDLCVVEALGEYEEQDPTRFRGLGATQPLFAWEDGDPLQRSDLAGFIKLAVVAEGYQAADGDTHGLRIGWGLCVVRSRQRFGLH